MHKTTTALAALAAMALGSSASALIIAAEYHPSSASQANGILDGNMEAQTFLAEETGPLNRMGMAFMLAGPMPSHPVVMELRNVVDDRPGQVVLASATLDAQDIYFGGFNDIQFSFFDFSGSGITLVSDTQYAVAVWTENPDFAYTVLAQSGNPYPNGGAFASTDGGNTWLGYGGFPSVLDFAFSVRLIPEPTTLGLLGLSGLTLLRRRKA